MGEIGDVDLTFDPQTRGDAMLDDLDAIRDATPVFWSERSRCWFILRHEDVVAAFLKRIPLTNEGRTTPVFHTIPRDEWAARIPALWKYSDLWITSSEGARHKRLRALMMKALSKKMVEQFRPYARERAEALVDTMLAEGEIEFNERISRAMTADVLFKLIGMPPALFPKLRDWTTGLMEGVGAAVPTPERLERADWSLREMNAAVEIEIADRRARPRDDLITGLLTAQEDGDQLTHDEVLAQMHTAIVAGHDTTMNTLTLAVAALGRDPAAWDYVRSYTGDMLDIVTELQRHVGMVGGQPRLAAEDFELHGHRIRKGDVVAVMIASANRDPAVFAEPDRLDFTRSTARSMTFAPGVHFCIGHLLAKMQLTEFIDALARKVRTIEVLDDPLDFMPIWVFRGVYQLNLRVAA